MEPANESRWREPSEGNQYLVDHALLLLRSFRRWTGRDLVASDGTPVEQARRLWLAPFAVVSHTTDRDPRFNYGNRTALAQFEMTWQQFTALLSRNSAPPVHQDERARMLAGVAEHGYAANYRGVRIARSGRRFWLEDGIIWNLGDRQNAKRGQAAMFDRWTTIDA